METTATTKKKKTTAAPAPPPETPGFNLVSVRDLVPGCTVRAANGDLMEVIRVDPVLDPRGGIYESNSSESVVWLRAAGAADGTPVILSGKIETKAA